MNDFAARIADSVLPSYVRQELMPPGENRITRREVRLGPGEDARWGRILDTLDDGMTPEQTAAIHGMNEYEIKVIIETGYKYLKQKKGSDHGCSNGTRQVGGDSEAG